MTYSSATPTVLRKSPSYFSTQHPLSTAASGQAVAVLSLGRLLATQGDASRNVPACAACHGEMLTGVAPAVPGLLGLPRDYLNSQFGAWRIGARHAAAPDCMAEVTRRLSVEDSSAAAAYLASRPSADAAPQSPVPPPPLDCGESAAHESRRERGRCCGRRPLTSSRRLV